MKKKSLNIFISSLLLIVVIFFAVNLLIAGVAQSCYEMPGCPDNWGCEATYWEAAPDCFIDCVPPRGRNYCVKDPI